MDASVNRPHAIAVSVGRRVVDDEHTDEAGLVAEQVDEQLEAVPVRKDQAEVVERRRGAGVGRGIGAGRMRSLYLHGIGWR